MDTLNELLDRFGFHRKKVSEFHSDAPPLDLHPCVGQYGALHNGKIVAHASTFGETCAMSRKGKYEGPLVFYVSEDSFNEGDPRISRIG